uniref:LIM zinc-binding domain-containing protein n=1 Tax=Knipowitschia caucasica TaxID=637954 RepID=A0AAV2K099_KNICA
MYQAAVSKRADNTSGVMEESELCSLPGGIASVRRQFETQEIASSHSVTQFHYQHRAVQEMSNSEVTVSSNNSLPASQLNHNHQNMVSYSGNVNYENYENDTEENFPRYTTRELRDHFEKTIEEAAPHNPVKITRDINRSKWASNMTQNTTASSEMYEASTTAASLENTGAAMIEYDDFPPPPADDSDYLPPPPPDLLQMPPENHDLPVYHYNPELEEPAQPSKCPLSREAYFKQRSKNELKRLYKHIHPEVRKNIEKEIDFNESETVQVQNQEFSYEEDQEEMKQYEEDEWEEILPGDVQSMRWMFENKPLDTIRDESPDEDDDDKKITQQEVILVDQEDEEISELTFASVREKMEFFEEAQKADINKTYVRKEPISIPERLGSDAEEECANERVRQFSRVLATPFHLRPHKFCLNKLTQIPKSELCTVCRRRAYPMDALIVDKKKYHKSCFFCEHCRNKLSVGNYVSLHGHFYSFVRSSLSPFERIGKAWAGLPAHWSAQRTSAPKPRHGAVPPGRITLLDDAGAGGWQ